MKNENKTLVNVLGAVQTVILISRVRSLVSKTITSIKDSRNQKKIKDSKDYIVINGRAYKINR